MSAVEIINRSGLALDEKRELKALLFAKPALMTVIEGDVELDDALLRLYISRSNSAGKI